LSYNPLVNYNFLLHVKGKFVAMSIAETLPYKEKAPVAITAKPLHELVRSALHIYFSSLDANAPPARLYDLVMGQIEPPLIEAALHYTNGNQSKTAEILGISRSTLRKKIKIYHLE
jgi:Fis family transcriptional regulator